MRVENGMEVAFDYEVYLENGELVDKSPPEQPLRYVHGRGQIIPGLEQALDGLEVGSSKELVLKPAEAYGEADPARILTVSKSQLPEDMEPEPGMRLQMMTPTGQTFIGVIKEVANDSVKVDFNHPLAGQTLRFKIKIVDIVDKREQS
jgi:FKBP-type peptidyl-prolyl cis-trans isomerase SlyD